MTQRGSMDVGALIGLETRKGVCGPGVVASRAFPLAPDLGNEHLFTNYFMLNLLHC